MNNTFSGFAHKAEELSAYIFSIDTFVISLITTEVISHTTDDPIAFGKWLVAHGVRNINGEVGSLVTEYYFPKILEAV